MVKHWHWYSGSFQTSHSHQKILKLFFGSKYFPDVSLQEKIQLETQLNLSDNKKPRR